MLEIEDSVGQTVLRLAAEAHGWSRGGGGGRSRKAVDLEHWSINGEWVFCRSRIYSQPSLDIMFFFTLEDASSLCLFCRWALMLGFPLPRNWFAHDPMRRNSVALGTILGSGIGFLSAATAVWVHTCNFQSHHPERIS